VLAQLSAGDGVCHAVQFRARGLRRANLKRLLADPKVLKLFHFRALRRGDVPRHLGVLTKPI